MVVRFAPTFLVTLAVALGGCIEERRGAGRRSARTEAAAAPVVAATPGDVDDKLSHLVPTDRLRVDVAPTDPWKGAADPLVTIVEYSDFQCPYCAKLATDLDRLVSLYPDDVRIVFKQFPLESHVQAEPAARAVLAAHAQGKFWPMHDRLFGNPSALQPADLERYAGEIELDMARFKAALVDPELQRKVSAQMNEGRVLELKSTPTFYVNGREVVGARGLEALQQLVEEEMAVARALVQAGSKRSEVYARIMKVAKGGTGKPSTADPTHRRGEPAKGANYAMPLGQGARRGPDDALVTILEFGAFTCAECRSARKVVDELVIKHPEIRHVVRQFPQDGADSKLAAKALVAAQRQDKFWELRNALLSWEGPVDEAGLPRLASGAGLDRPRLDKDMADPTVTAQIDADVAVANKIRGSTPPPFFFVNGRIVIGPPVLAELEALVAEESAKAEQFMRDQGAPRADLYETMRKTWRGAQQLAQELGG